MAPSDQLSRLAPSARRLLTDDRIHDQVDRIYANLRGGTTRARRKGAKGAVGDRKTRRQLGAAAAAAVQVARALNQPEPPKRHLGRRVIVMSAASVGAVAGYRRLTGSPAESPNG